MYPQVAQSYVDLASLGLTELCLPLVSQVLTLKVPITGSHRMTSLNPWHAHLNTKEPITFPGAGLPQHLTAEMLSVLNDRPLRRFLRFLWYQNRCHHYFSQSPKTKHRKQHNLFKDWLLQQVGVFTGKAAGGLLQKNLQDLRSGEKRPKTLCCILQSILFLTWKIQVKTESRFYGK